MPQNKNLSTAWQKMLGANWSEDRDRWLNTIGNLTLTGYNSELGDKPFLTKKAMIEEKQTKVVILYQDVQDKDEWNATTIQDRGKRLSSEVQKLFTYKKPAEQIVFNDPRYQEYTCADSQNATYKSINYYVLMGERVIVDSYADMMRSVAEKLYDLQSGPIEEMARSNERFPGWIACPFSYDINQVKKPVKIPGSEIYMPSGYSASGCIDFVRALIKLYELDIETDFVYSARSYKSEKE